MKKTIKKRLQKATAILLSAIMVLSVFAVIPADLFKASAATTALFEDRLELDFNNNWKFNLGDESGAYAKAYDDSAWETVELPHDFSISQDFYSAGVEAESGNLPGGTGWYRKTFVMSSDARDQSVYLNFDGSYKDTYVYVNGTLVGENHYGYNSFSFDITEHLVCNGSTANIIAVKVENQLPSSRWYSGSGIYRDVTMTIVDPIHVDLYGTYVTTPNLESSNGADGTVNAKVTLVNTQYEEPTVTVKAQILDASGNAVGTTASVDVVPGGKEKTEVTLNPSVSNPTLWSSWDIGTPYLYTLRVQVVRDGAVVDTYDTEFGYRWFDWHADNGFSLNGTNLKLEGVCLHHDQGALGAVQTYDAIYRQVSILKDMGCNTIRTSHGSPSDVFMDVCNELGMLVMDEFFDGWDTAKNDNYNDFSVYFDEVIDTTTNKILNAEAGQMWYEFVVTQTVKRDRNDPANVIWDVGNELNEGAATGNFTAIAQNLQTIIDELDPTRPLCQGNNGPGDSAKAAVDGFMDVIGGNYNTADWISLMTGTSDNRSTKPYVGTETASAISTRGHYSTPYYHSVLTMTSAADSNKDINAYDTGKVSWGQVAAAAWYNTIIYDWNSGEYVWTGFDYIGEPTPYNNTTGTYGAGYPSSSYFGIVDTAGFGKDTYYLYRSMWNEHSTTAHIVPGTWNSSELYVDGSGYVDVAVYSNAARIELLGDGNVIARATANTTTTNAGHKYQTWTETAVDTTNVATTEFYSGDGKDLYSQFHVKHAAYNTLSVKAYDANGNEITDTVGTKSVSNTTAAKITAKAWTYGGYTADGDSYAYIEYTAVDANGNFDSTYNGTLNLVLEGNEAVIVGVDNGDPVTTQKFQQASALTSDTTATIQMFNGKALAILRTTEEVGNVEITATSNVTVDGVTVEVNAEAGDELIDEFEEVIAQPDDLKYESSIYDEYVILYDKITAGGSNTTTGNEYVKYTATPNGTTATVAVTIPDGEYIITGIDDQGGVSKGVLTHTAHSSGGFVSDGSTGTPASTADTWFFEKTTGGYYIYYTDNSGTKQYLTISNNQVYASTTPYTLAVNVDASGNVTIGFGSTYLNYDGGVSNRVNYWSAATNLTLYSVTRGASVTTQTVQQANSITSGRSYIVATSSGSVLNNNLSTSGGTTTPPPADSDKWTITTSGNYYTFRYNNNGTTRYLSIGSSVSTSTSSTNVRFGDTNLSDGSTLRTASGTTRYLVVPTGSGTASSTTRSNSATTLYFYEVVETTTNGTTVTRFSPDTTSTTYVPPVENGTYVIYNNDSRTGSNYSDGILSGSIESLGSNQYGIPIVITAPENNIITTDRENAYTFTLVDGTTNKYYIVNNEGKYLTIGSSGGSVSFSDTPASVDVYGRTDGSVFIYNADSSQFLDHWYNGTTQDHYSSWSSSTTSTEVNRIFVLYKNENGAVSVPAGKENLHNALVEGIQNAPGTYSAATYNTLFAALKDGYAVFEDSSASTGDISAATLRITNAIAALEVEMKYIPSTLWKYGYYPQNTSSPYANGGADFNSLTYASMEAIIRADDSLMSQIKDAIGYDTRTWASDTEKTTALNTAVTQYAKIYSISFTGNGVANDAQAENFAKTSWNVWCKTGTQGAGEASEEGASVQGIFSALRVDGQPVDHADYSVLPYGNAIDNANRENFNTINGLSVSLTINGTATDVTLPALEGISVHINEMFKKEDIYANGTDASQGYARKYWDLGFPFLVTTNQFGINTYTYSSSDTSYLFQADFDDANNSATAVLTPVDEWSITRDGKGEGNGFFPFNYQQGATTLSGEKAIYHYALNYDMEFYIPLAGTYADGEDVVFEFSGDDDVLVYIDDVLVLDNGGLHGARSASINFTDATISYQYAMNVDAADGLVESTTENAIVYAYDDPDKATTCNGDELAALEKLQEVRTDGDYHTFSFYYVERGSTDSNCEMSFNLQETSEHVLLYDQTIVVDNGLPVEDFSITEDNFLSQDGIAAGTKTMLLGIVEGNTSVSDIVEFEDVENLCDTFKASGDVLTVPNMKYGTCTVTRVDDEAYRDNAVVSYTPNTIRMTGEDYFYVCSEITDDPTYAEGTVYHQYEKVTFIPATSVYYEDNFGGEGISFIDGSTTDNSGHGVWETVYTEGADATTFAGAKQSADFVGDSLSNPYGFDPVYAGLDTTKDYTKYSGFSAQKVTVSAANNTMSGGTNPTVEFTFTGTGFDVISMTDNTTGVFYMEIFDENGTKVGKRSVVDTYYGYSYGQLYADENGEATFEETETLLYRSAENEAVTRVATYYSTNDLGETIIVTEPSYLDVSGYGYTDTPTYYDADGNLTETETENIAYAYAYAYGWITSDDVEGLYQIPVIKKTGLDYGTYTVVITAMYTSMFDHTGEGQFDLYLDAIRIYDPAGKDDGATSTIITEYKLDNESYPNYLSIKDMLIGADSLSKDSSTQGVIFIDGIAALNNDLEKYKLAGPNNELYLAKGQAVAFEIWATAVPDEVQLGMKSATGNPVVKVTYNGQENTKDAVTLKTATEMNYIINNLLPSNGKLTWSEVVIDGTVYYRTGTVVIQNTSTDDSILSLTSMKWTFTGVGQYGHYETTLPETPAVMSFMARRTTVSDAYSMVSDNNTPDTDGTVDGGNTDTDVVPDDNEDTNDNNDGYQEELTWIQKIIRIIKDFFMKIFSMV